MSLDAAWALGRDALFATMGLPAVVTRPAPDDTPVTTNVIWVSPSSPEMPTGGTLRRREAVRTLAIAKAAVPTVPRRTRIAVAEMDGGAVRIWEVDVIDLIEADCTRVLVVPAPEAA